MTPLKGWPTVKGLTDAGGPQWAEPGPPFRKKNFPAAELICPGWMGFCKADCPIKMRSKVGFTTFGVYM